MSGRTIMNRRFAVSGAALVLSLIIGTFALAQKQAAGGELGSCAAYSGLPSEDNDTAGMVLIRGGTFVMGSERHRPEERSPTQCASMVSGSIATK
jgi:formylglycine-generating enzyme